MRRRSDTARRAPLLRLCALLILNLLLTGCAAWGRPGIDDMAEDFFAALDAHDAGGLKGLFAPSALAEDEDMDAAIEALFALYPGPTEDWRTDAPPGVSTNRGGPSRRTISNWYPVTAGGANYYCCIRYTSADEEHPENVGLRDVIFVTEKVRCSEEFLRTWKDLPAGLTVLSCAEGDYETCRIGGNAYVYTPPEQLPTLEDILSFTASDTSCGAFRARFGPPCAVSPYSEHALYYALPDEDGARRYAEITFYGENDTASAVILWSERGYHALNVPWKAEKSGE